MNVDQFLCHKEGRGKAWRGDPYLLLNCADRDCEAPAWSLIEDLDQTTNRLSFLQICQTTSEQPESNVTAP